MSGDKMSVKGDWNEDPAPALARHCRHQTSDIRMPLHSEPRTGDKKVGVAGPLSSARRSAHHHYTRHPALSALSTAFGNTQECLHSYNK